MDARADRARRHSAAAPPPPGTGSREASARRSLGSDRGLASGRQAGGPGARKHVTPKRFETGTPGRPFSQLEQAGDAAVGGDVDLLGGGTLGRPGMVMMSPVSATTKPAPALTLTSRTVMRKPSGRAELAGSSVKLYCVLAMQTGMSPKPSSSSCASCLAAAGRSRRRRRGRRLGDGLDLFLAAVVELIGKAEVVAARSHRRTTSSASARPPSPPLAHTSDRRHVDAQLAAPALDQCSSASVSVGKRLMATTQGRP